MVDKKTGWTVPGAVVDEAYKGTAAANPVLLLGPDGAPVPVRAPYHSLPGGVDLLERPDGAHAGGPGAKPGSETVRDTRSPAQIEADLDATRTRLTGTLDELQERLSPRTLVRQAGRGIKAGFVDPGIGRARPGPVALAAGAAAAGVSLLAGARALRHRS
jgi:hypothetical protein